MNGIKALFAGLVWCALFSNFSVLAQLLPLQPHLGEIVAGLYLPETHFGNQISLTFDDGPNKNTLQILDLLKKYQIKATFFVLGVRLIDTNGHLQPGAKPILQRMITEGHKLGNHTFSHDNLASAKFTDIRTGLPEIEKEFTQTQAAVDQTLGYSYPMTYIRPPYGERGRQVTSPQAAELYQQGWVDLAALQLGKQLLMWQVDSLDWKIHDSDAPMTEAEVEKRIYQQLAEKEGGVVLMHDIHSSTVNVLAKVLEQLAQEKRYRFVTLADLMAQKYQ